MVRIDCATTKQCFFLTSGDPHKILETYENAKFYIAFTLMSHNKAEGATVMEFEVLIAQNKAFIKYGCPTTEQSLVSHLVAIIKKDKKTKIAKKLKITLGP